jgi:hypothetical protein
MAHGPEEYLMAGVAQAFSSFLSTGITARVVQHFSPIRSAPVSYFFGSLIPAAMTFVMSLTVHLWNNTPEVLASCVAPTIISYTTSYVTNYITRRGYLLPGNYQKEQKQIPSQPLEFFNIIISWYNNFNYAEESNNNFQFAGCLCFCFVFFLRFERVREQKSQNWQLCLVGKYRLGFFELL